MRTVFHFLAVLCLSFLCGCGIPTGNKKYVTVDFEKDEPLCYRFISHRDITFDWGEMSNEQKRSGSKIEKSAEQIEMDVCYNLVEIDSSGAATVEVKLGTVAVKRGTGKGGSIHSANDAAEVISGRSFIIKVAPDGRIIDSSGLTRIIQEAGAAAMRDNAKGTPIKDPDMIGDLVAGLCFMWDSISSNGKLVTGIKTGDSWESVLSVPNPMVIRQARKVAYTLKEMRTSKDGQIAVISSNYSISEAVPKSWVNPYTGKFMISGKYGTLRNLRVLELTGQGEELFNIDKGESLGYQQSYLIKVKADFMMPLPGVNPVITIDQKLKMEKVG